MLAIKLGTMNKGLGYKGLGQVFDVAPPRVSCSGVLTLLKKIDEPSEAGSLVMFTFLRSGIKMNASTFWSYECGGAGGGGGGA